MTFCGKSDVVYKNKLFSSSKKPSPSSDSSNNNSPQSVSSNSPISPDKKKAKSNSKEEFRSPKRIVASIYAGVRESLKRKEHGSSKSKKATRTSLLPQESFFSFPRDNAIPVVPLPASGSGMLKILLICAYLILEHFLLLASQVLIFDVSKQVNPRHYLLANAL